MDYNTELMMRFKDGDLDAYQELVERLHRRVIRLAYRYLTSQPDAEDIAQEVFVKLYKARHKWEPRASISTWVFRITANACLNVIRSRRTSGAVSLETARSDGDPMSEAIPERNLPEPDENLETLETAELVRRAIEMLPETQRMAILLNRFEGLSYAEVASALGTSEAAVKSMLFRARATLKGLLEKHDEFSQ